jgi:hypothetical protein
MEKTIEIIYDVADIPGVNPHDDYSLSALDFRNEAMDFIEQALCKWMPDAEWSFAESGMGGVNFGFCVPDFDQAEAIIRSAVKDTKFEKIRQFQRIEFDDDD